MKPFNRFFTLILLLSLFFLLGCSGNSKENKIPDGDYLLSVSKEGGTGKAYIETPAKAVVSDGNIVATIVWSSKNYDYMIVNGVKYISEAKANENSVFTFPIDGIPCDMTVIGDTTAMSEPHEVEYKLHFSLESSNE